MTHTSLSSPSIETLHALRAAALSPDPDVGPVSLGQLLDGLAPRLARIARPWAASLPRPHLDVDDVVQSLQIHVAHVLPQCRAATPTQFAAWISVTAHHHLLHLHRSERRAAGREAVALAGVAVPEARDAMPAAAEPDVDAEGAALRPGTQPDVEPSVALAAVLAALPANARRVLELRVAPGATWASVARELGVSRGAARQRYVRALDAAQRLGRAWTANHPRGVSLEGRDVDRRTDVAA